MSLDKKLINDFIEVTSFAAMEASKFIGKNDKISADKAAVDIMRKKLNQLTIDGRIVIGEGELDEAPMLYIGEKLGTKDGIKLDIAVDPVEGTNFVAKNLPGAISVMAITEEKNLFSAPETYMHKIAVGPNIPKDSINLNYNLEKNLNNLADVKNKKLSDIRVCLLNRPRHLNIIKTLDKLKVRKKLITDGDVSGALLVSDEKYDVDMFIGIGGGPEGVLAAAALDCYNCFFQGKLIFEDENDKIRAKKMGIINLDKVYDLNEIIKGDAMFFASGITGGDLVNGVVFNVNSFITETFITHKSTNIKEIKKKEYSIS